MHVDGRREPTQLEKMYEQCFSMELKTIEKTLCLCRKPGPSSRNPAKGKEVMNKASEEARFHRRWPGEEPDPAPAPGLLSPDSCLKKCISRGDYPFSKRRRAGLPLFCRPTTVAALEERRGERKAKQKTLLRQWEKSSLAQQTQSPSKTGAANSFPVARGSNRNANQAGLLAPAYAPRRLPMLAHSGNAGLLAVTVAGPRRISTGFPIKSCDTQSKI